MPGLDTHTGGIDGVSNAFTVPLFSTDTTNEVVFVVCVAQSGTGAGADGGVAQVSSVSDDAGLSWQKRAGIFNTASSAVTELWYAATSGKLTNDNINIFLNRGSRAAFFVFAVTGLADITDPFDANGTNPSTVGYPTATGASPPLSTNQARSILLLACGEYGPGSPTFSAPFSLVGKRQGTYCTAFAGSNIRTTQAANIQCVVTGGGIDDLNIIGDACKGPGWLRYDVFVGGT